MAGRLQRLIEPHFQHLCTRLKTFWLFRSRFHPEMGDLGVISYLIHPKNANYPNKQYFCKKAPPSRTMFNAVSEMGTLTRVTPLMLQTGRGDIGRGQEMSAVRLLSSLR